MLLKSIMGYKFCHKFAEGIYLIGMLLVIISFLIWYGPASFANVYACDDYWHGLNVNTMGFFDAQCYYWNNWEGSYTHTFFATLPHVFSFKHMPFVCNILSSLLFVISTSVFLRTYIKLKACKSVCLSLVILCFVYLFSVGGSEIVFWVCANNTYLLGISTLLSAMVVYHMSSMYKPIRYTLLMTLIFLTVGNKIQFVYALFVLILTYEVCNGNRAKRDFIFVMVTLLVSSSINIFASGNITRLRYNFLENQDNVMSIAEVFCFRFRKIIHMLILSFLLYPFLGYKLKVVFSKNNRLLIKILLSWVFLFFGDTVIMKICFNDSGPCRCFIVMEIYTLMLGLVMLSNIKVLFNRYVKSATWMLAVYVLVISNVQCVSKLSSTFYYSYMAQERDKHVIEDIENRDVNVLPLPDSSLLLSYYCNDSVWIQNVYIPYMKSRFYKGMK